ncbi:hypothetical protein PUN28_020634 [Cardiocondyla obscurior]|uniref:Uncharacterized protein n=1 Tax=Cardiocondyla obscurior TaxID=286306 RepID=A0AAW2E7H3_9HYME
MTSAISFKQIRPHAVLHHQLRNQKLVWRQQATEDDLEGVAANIRDNAFCDENANTDVISLDSSNASDASIRTTASVDQSEVERLKVEAASLRKSRELKASRDAEYMPPPLKTQKAISEEIDDVEMEVIEAGEPLFPGRLSSKEDWPPAVRPPIKGRRLVLSDKTSIEIAKTHSICEISKDIESLIEKGFHSLRKNTKGDRWHDSNLRQTGSPQALPLGPGITPKCGRYKSVSRSAGSRWRCELRRQIEN